MKSEFSENAFIHYHTWELEETYGMGYPRFISAAKEAKEGYDVKFSDAVYPCIIQYKVSEFFKTPKAKYWSDFNAPFFRFNLHPKNNFNQHKCLVSHSKTIETYYCAPAFFEEDALFEYHVNKEIVNKSVLIDVKSMAPLPLGNKHCVTFSMDTHHRYMHSESKRLEYLDKESTFRNIEAMPLKEVMITGFSLLASLEGRIPLVLKNDLRVEMLFEEQILKRIKEGYYDKKAYVGHKLDHYKHEAFSTKDEIEVYNEQSDFVEETVNFIRNNVNEENYHQYLSKMNNALMQKDIYLLMKR